MSRLVNLCGKAIHLEDVVSFATDRRSYLFIPCFREIAQVDSKKSFFGKETNTVSLCYVFDKQIPYGVVLGDKESPWPGESYAYKTAGEIIGLDLFKSIKKATGDAAHLAARALKIDTSINQKIRILVDGREVKECRYDELPAKLICRDGRKIDVYKNSPIYNLLGQNITPHVESVPVLEVYMTKNKKLLFFGDGIDIDNVDEPYQALMIAYNELHAEKDNKKRNAAPKITLPKLGSIKLQSPIAIKKAEEEKEESEV